MKNLKNYTDFINEAKTGKWSIVDKTFGEFVTWYNGFGFDDDDDVSDDEIFDGDWMFESGGNEVFKSKEELDKFIIKNRDVKCDINVNYVKFGEYLCHINIDSVELKITCNHEPFTKWI